MKNLPVSQCQIDYSLIFMQTNITCETQVLRVFSYLRQKHVIKIDVMKLNLLSNNQETI